ncbi:MAG: leucyl/phenylalanyl-tRNA--protein transferase [Myxococcota bacterium]
MPVFQLDDRLVFPPPHLADPDGLLAVGGDLRPERLLLAYSMGVFPWPTEGFPLLWHSPDPRYVLAAEDLHVPRRLRRTLRQQTFRFTLDEAFETVIEACAEMGRPGQDGTWITPEMMDAYVELHRLGFAHSSEAWVDGALVGGLYGVSLGGAFFGESMFARVSDASKGAFVTLVEQLRRWDIGLIDAQVHTRHLERFGASHWRRERYLEELAARLEAPTQRGRWVLDEPLDRGEL